MDKKCETKIMKITHSAITSMEMTLFSLEFFLEENFIWFKNRVTFRELFYIPYVYIKEGQKKSCIYFCKKKLQSFSSSIEIS